MPVLMAALFLVPAFLAAPAHAAPLPVAPEAPLDQSEVMGQVTPGLVDINTTLDYHGAVGAGTGIVLDPS